MKNGKILVLVVVVSLAFVIIFGEFFFRLIGHQPWIAEPYDKNIPIMHEDDLVLGWRNKAGSYLIPPYDPAGSKIQITFLEDGRRLTAPAKAPKREKDKKIIFVGGSFTQGWAVSDEETYSWKIQERNRNVP